MNFIFQFGGFTASENSWKDFFSTLGAVAIPLLVFYLTIRHTKSSEEAKQKQFETDRLTYFTAMFDQVIDLINRQIREINTFVEELNKDPLTTPQLGMFATHNLDRLANKIDHAEYYHAFVKRHRSSPDALKDFDQIASRTDYFDSLMKKIYSYLELSVRHDYDRKIVFQNSLREANTRYDELMTKLSADESKSDIFNQLKSLSGQYAQKHIENPANINVPVNQLIDPVLKLIRPLMNDPDFFSLFMKVSQAKVDAQAIIYSSRKTASDFKAFGDQLSDALSDLTKHGKVLDKYRSPIKSSELELR